MKSRWLQLAATGILLLVLLPAAQPANADAFADPAFQRLWERTDKPLADGQASRTWIWGPAPRAALMQRITLNGASVQRQEQFFDKSRMEINPEVSNSNDPWHVTNALLAVELISGMSPDGYLLGPDAPVAGDNYSDAHGFNNAPSFRSVQGVTSLGAPYANHDAAPRTPGAPITDFMERLGEITTYEQHLDKWGEKDPAGLPNVTFSTYIAQTKHNIAKPFWDFFSSQGKVYEGGGFKQGQLLDWVFTMGYPISEPYWAEMAIGYTRKLVLFQVFQRRILTYTPANAPAWQVEMGNLGLTDYKWRFKRPTPEFLPQNSAFNYTQGGWANVWSVMGNSLNNPQTFAQSGAVERFEYGQMIYLNMPIGNYIFVQYSDSTWWLYKDAFSDGGTPESYPAPPAGRYAPQRGFGHIWRDKQGVRDKLGWAIEPETPAGVASEQFANGWTVSLFVPARMKIAQFICFLAPQDPLHYTNSTAPLQRWIPAPYSGN